MTYRQRIAYVCCNVMSTSYPDEPCWVCGARGLAYGPLDYMHPFKRDFRDGTSTSHVNFSKAKPEAVGWRHP